MVEHIKIFKAPSILGIVEVKENGSPQMMSTNQMIAMITML